MLNPYDAEKHHIALGSAVRRTINYLDIAPGIIMPYWYRLGEAGPWPGVTTDDFAKDSSGHDRHLTAVRDVDPWEAGVMPHPPPTPNIPGGLIYGDDGAIQFNQNYAISSSFFWPWKLAGGGDGTRSMEAPFRGGGSGAFAAVGTGSTFVAWVAFMPPGPGDSFWPDGVAAQTGAYPLVSTWYRDFGVSNYGSRLGFAPGTGKLSYHVGQANLANAFFWQTPGGMIPGEWNHFATTIQKVGTNLYQRKIYLNAIKVLDVTGVLNSVEIGDGAVPGMELSIGSGYTNDIWQATGRGKVDEVAYWEGVLTEEQIMEVWHAGASVTNPDDFYGFTLENAYAKFVQRTALPGATDVGGSLDLISPKPEESIWTGRVHRGHVPVPLRH